MFNIEKVSVKIGRKFVYCILGQGTNGIVSIPLSGWSASDRWQLNLKDKKATSLTPGRDTLINK